MEQFCLNATTAEVEIAVNGLKTTIKFNSPPINIEIQEAGEFVSWKLQRKIDSVIVFSWTGTYNDNFTWERTGYLEAEEKYTSFNFYTDTAGDNNYTLLGNFPVVSYFFTDFTGNNTTNFDVDYRRIDEEILSSQIVFSDSESSYSYPPEGLIYKIKCDDCEPGDCKASKSEYPGYVCLDCKKLQDKAISIGRKIDGITRR